MLKKLLSDLASNKIDISIALKKSKIILTVISDTELQAFIKNELEGYDVKDVPAYRIGIGRPKGHYRNNFNGRLMILPLSFAKINEQTGINFNERKIGFSVIELETLLKKSTEGNGELCIDFTPDQIRLLFNNEAINASGWFLENAWWAFSENTFRKIYSQIENRLIDILVRLNKEYPNLEKELKFMEEEKTQSIHTNIHGNVIGSNLGIGDNVKQKDISINYNQDIQEIIGKIIALGFDKQDTVDLEQLLIEQKKTGGNIGKQLLDWIGKISTKAVEKGIEYKIPKIMSILTHFF